MSDEKDPPSVGVEPKDAEPGEHSGHGMCGAMELHGHKDWADANCSKSAPQGGRGMTDKGAGSGIPLTNKEQEKAAENG